MIKKLTLCLFWTLTLSLFGFADLPPEAWESIVMMDIPVGVRHTTFSQQADIITTVVHTELKVQRQGSMLHLSQEWVLKESPTDLISLEAIQKDQSGELLNHLHFRKESSFWSGTDTLGNHYRSRIPSLVVTPYKMSQPKLFVEQVYARKPVAFLIPDASLGPMPLYGKNSKKDQGYSFIWSSNETPPVVRFTTDYSLDNTLTGVSYDIQGVRYKTMSREQAFKQLASGSQTDIIQHFGIPLENPEPIYRGIPKIDYIVTTPIPRLLKDLGQFQRLQYHTSEKGLLTVEPYQDSLRSPVPLELSDFLGSNSFIHPQDPAIIELLQKAESKSPYSIDNRREKMQWLRDYTHSFISEKNYASAFDSDLKILEHRSGDCTEHAVLLASLGRAAKIPTRVAFGLVLVSDIFIGHAWVEALIDGHWEPFDATSEQAIPSVGATHIKMGHSSLSKSSDSHQYAEFILDALTNLKIRLKKIYHKM